MKPNDAIIHRFAEYCAGYHEDNLDHSDYLNNSTVVYDDGYYLVIDVALGAFDHGAGNCLLIVQGTKEWVAYEGEMTLFAVDGKLIHRDD